MKEQKKHITKVNFGTKLAKLSKVNPDRLNAQSHIVKISFLGSWEITDKRLCQLGGFTAISKRLLGRSTTKSEISTYLKAEPSR